MDIASVLIFFWLRPCQLITFFSIIASSELIHVSAMYKIRTTANRSYILLGIVVGILLYSKQFCAEIIA